MSSVTSDVCGEGGGRLSASLAFMRLKYCYSLYRGMCTPRWQSLPHSGVMVTVTMVTVHGPCRMGHHGLRQF
jgi:hypothetical protein